MFIFTVLNIKEFVKSWVEDDFLQREFLFFLWMTGPTSPTNSEALKFIGWVFS